MMANAVALTLALAAAPGSGALDGVAGKKSDRFETGSGPLEIVFLGHASLIFSYGGTLVYVDPVSRYGDYAAYPDADLLLVTHEHGDHLDAGAIAALSAAGTRVALPEASRTKLGKGEALGHGARVEAAGVSAVAVPAYNVSPDRLNYHPKARKDNGYVLSFGDLRVYVAGDTEPIPEMAELGRIDVAFLPMNLPFTMTPEQVASAARTIKPRILYPYHFGTTDTSALTRLLADERGVELRLRDLQ